MVTGGETFTFAGLVDPSSVFAHIDTPATNVQYNIDWLDTFFQQAWYSLFSYDLSGFGLEPVYFTKRRFVEHLDQVDMMPAIGSAWCAGLRAKVEPGGQVTFWVGYY